MRWAGPATLIAGPAVAQIEVGGRMALQGDALREITVALLIGLALLFVSGAGAILAARLRIRRREKRFPCSLSVRTEPPFGDRVRIIDLSRRGARLRIVPPPVPGTKVRIIWQDLRLDTTVVWSGEVFAGVRLHRTLPAAAMRRMLAAGPVRHAAPGMVTRPEMQA
ncbi:PilZ domain-containing protein [Wenxinia marina]|uniref:PilZ domain-containing protein n=1 Tax=Wenxinia marina TaxID=390641 RepID=UPI00036097E8|nr:PilZ domain-containing protein [Wenxinia marina]